MKKFFEQKKSAIVSGMSNNKGFSLVELIIVVAIMAVLMGVLAPQYLRFVESSRVQTDMVAVNEVIKTVRIALATFDGIPTNTTVIVGVDGGVLADGGTSAEKEAMQTQIDRTLGTNGSTVTAMSSAYYKSYVGDVTLGVANDNGVPYVFLADTDVADNGDGKLTIEQLSYDLKISKSGTAADDIITVSPGAY